MKLLKRSLILSSLIVPGVLNAAMLRFDITATESTFVGDIGILPGSYFIVDTNVPNSSIEPTSTLFANSIVGGHIDSMHPINGPVSADITDANSGSITATNDGTSTTWTIPVVGDTSGQPATMTMEFGGVELFQELEPDLNEGEGLDEYYREHYRGGSIASPGLTIDINELVFSVASDGSAVTSAPVPAPVPLPPTFFLMASALGMMLWRSNLSFSQFRQLLTNR